MKTFSLILGILLVVLSILVGSLLWFMLAFSGGGEEAILPFLLIFIPGIVLIVLGAKTSKGKRISCDGCKQHIQGEYIAIRPEGTKDKYCYCSKFCRDEYHAQIMKDALIQNWSPPSK